MRKLYAFLLSNIITITACFSQDTTLQVPLRYYNKVANKAATLQYKITKQNAHLLAQLETVEKNIYQSLYQLDSLKAKDLMTDGLERYQLLQQGIAEKTGVISKITSGAYIQGLDSMHGALSYLSKVKGLSEVKELQNALEKVKQMGSSVQQAELIKNFIHERKEQLQAIVSQYSSIPAAVTRQLAQYSKTLSSYRSEIQEIKSIINEPDKAERLLLKQLQKTNAFQNWMQQNNQLAMLFGSNNGGDIQSIAGLQSINTVNQLIQNRIGSGGQNARQLISAQLGQAQNELRNLQSRFSQGNTSSSDDFNMDYAPTQRTKSFWKHFEKGFNMQTTKRNGVFPSANELGINLGYKPNDKSVIGIGMAYRFGLGDNILNKIQWTHEGISLRSYIDVRLKNSWWISGGYEKNYWSRFNNINTLRNVAWQQSGLIGITRKIKMPKKEIKLQLLYDFLGRYTTDSSPFILRWGTNF